MPSRAAIDFPAATMEALAVDEVPSGPGWQFEPKWDGFRCLVLSDGERVELRSKAGQPLTRYFPEVIDHLRALPLKRFLLDGELIVAVDGALSFGALLQRIHPADSRVRRLAAETPASLVLFDLLDDGTRSLVAAPLCERRAALEVFAQRYLRGDAIRLSPATTRRDLALSWLDELGPDLDGVVAKRLDEPYQAGERAMRKIKRVRTADCVVGGYRHLQQGGGVGSLLLGLYDDHGALHYVGHTSNIPAAERAALTKRLERLRGESAFTGRSPGGPSRWARGRSTEWIALRPELVVEVAFDHASEGRFRHGARFVRWRPDKAPRQCRMEQLGHAAAAI